MLFLQSCGSNEIEKAKNLINIKAYDQAIQLLEKDIQEHPKNFQSHFTLANAYACKAYENLNEPSHDLIKKSISSYKSATFLKPDFFSIYYNLGSVLYFAKNNGEAIETLSKSLDLKPQNYGAILFLSQIYKDQGKYEKAEKYFGDALKIIPMKYDWTKLNYFTQRDSAGKGTFIVEDDSVVSYCNDESNKKSHLLMKYNIQTFHAQKGEKLFFIDKENPIYVPRFAYATYYSSDFGRLFRRIDLQDPIPWEKIKSNSIKKVKFLGWNTYKMSYEEIVYLEKYVNIKDVYIGSGKIKADNELVNILKDERNIHATDKNKILEGYIKRGMPYRIILLMMGNLTLKEFLPIDEQVILVYANNMLEFSFCDGVLDSWKEKKPL